MPSYSTPPREKLFSESPFRVGGGREGREREKRERGGGGGRGSGGGGGDGLGGGGGGEGRGRGKAGCFIGGVWVNCAFGGEGAGWGGRFLKLWMRKPPGGGNGPSPYVVPSFWRGEVFSGDSPLYHLIKGLWRFFILSSAKRPSCSHLGK